MADRNFDTLSRLIAVQAPQRRAALRLLVGGTLGAAGMRWVGENAAAGCRKDRDCPGRKRCCDGRCTNPDKDNQNCGQCGDKCQGAERCCNGTCRDLEKDERHCGKCFDQCRANEQCRHGRCRGDCLDPGQLCPLGEPDRCCSPDSFCKDLGGTGLCCLPVDARCDNSFECCTGGCDTNLGVCLDD